jgi:hypothetical protein
MPGLEQWPWSTRGGADESQDLLDPDGVVIVPLSSDNVDPRMWGELMDRLSARAWRGGAGARGVVITARKRTLRERVQLTGRGPSSGFRLLPAHEGPERSRSRPEIVQEPSAEWVSIHIPLDASQRGRITIGVDQGQGRRRWKQITAVAVALSGLVFGAAVTVGFQAWSDEQTPATRAVHVPGKKREGHKDRSALKGQGRLERASPARAAACPEVPSRPVSSPLPAAKPRASARAARVRARRLWRLRRAWRWRRIKARRHVRLARHALSVGRVKLATKHATRAVRLDPNNRLARRILARALKQLKLSRILRDLWTPALPATVPTRT